MSNPNVPKPFSADLDVRVTDTSLRDGSHHKRHQFTVQEVRDIVGALDAAGVPVLEVTHGDGLGGSSFNYGFSKTPEQELIKAAAETAKQAKIAFLMLPGVGVKEDIKISQDNGASICRIATHCTEADVSIQHFNMARDLGLETVGFLMMAHSTTPENLAKQARIMADMRLPVRVRRRLGGRPCAGPGHGSRLRPGRRTRQRRPGRLPRPREPRPRRRQLRLRGARRCHPDRRQRTPFRRGRGQPPRRGFHRRLRQARHQDRRRLLRRHGRRRRRCPPGHAERMPPRPPGVDDGLRRMSTPPSSATPNARPNATASPPPKCSSAQASANSSAARKTNSSTSPWNSSAKRKRPPPTPDPASLLGRNHFRLRPSGISRSGSCHGGISDKSPQ